MSGFVPNPAAIYLTDNGAAYCGEHLGSSAKHTGRDISGQEIYRLTPEDVQACIAEDGWQPSCGMCGKQASQVHLAGGVS